MGRPFLFLGRRCFQTPHHLQIFRGIDVIWIQREGAFQMGDGLVESLLARQCQAQITMSFGVIFVEA